MCFKLILSLAHSPRAIIMIMITQAGKFQVLRILPSHARTAGGAQAQALPAPGEFRY